MNKDVKLVGHYMTGPGKFQLQFSDKDGNNSMIMATQEEVDALKTGKDYVITVAEKVKK